MAPLLVSSCDPAAPGGLVFAILSPCRTETIFVRGRFRRGSGFPIRKMQGITRSMRPRRCGRGDFPGHRGETVWDAFQRRSCNTCETCRAFPSRSSFFFEFCVSSGYGLPVCLYKNEIAVSVEESVGRNWKFGDFTVNFVPWVSLCDDESFRLRHQNS